MLARYVAVWKLHGANKLATEQPSVTLALLAEPKVTATITTNPEPHFLHIDKAGALATQLLKGLFAPAKEGSPEERLAAEIEAVKARRAEQTADGVFLLFEGEKDVPPPEFTARKDTEEFAICLDAVDKTEIRAAFRPFVNAALAALSMSLAPNADRQVERIGEAVYLVDLESGKPIYAFTMSGGSVRVSIAAPLTPEVIAAAGGRVSKLVHDKTMGRPTRLANTSFGPGTDALQAFIAAWSALEIFVNASFEALYEARWFDIMESGAPAAAKPVFERFKDVMSDKYRLADKFLIIAAVLGADAATADAEEFRKLKGTRDDLLHASEIPTHLPTEAVQKLLLKYMRLHLDTQS